MRRATRSAIAVFALLFSLLVVPAVAGAAPSRAPGNSGAAKACQDGGYTNYVRSDGTAFRNTDECVSYVVRGGLLLLNDWAFMFVRKGASMIEGTGYGYTDADLICYQVELTDRSAFGGETCIVATGPTLRILLAVPCEPETFVRVTDVTTGQVVRVPVPGC